MNPAGSVVKFMSSKVRWNLAANFFYLSIFEYYIIVLDYEVI